MTNNENMEMNKKKSEIIEHNKESIPAFITIDAATKHDNELILAGELQKTNGETITHNTLIPANTVDAAGNVWDTIGENIRSGERNFSVNDARKIVDILFPVGSVYCGENNFILSIGKWNPISESDWTLVYLGVGTPTGSFFSVAPACGTSSTAKAISLRMWKRVS